MITDKQINKMAESTLLMIPTYAEEENILPLVDAIFRVLPKINVVFVDDNSPDRTQERIMDAMKAYPQMVHLIDRPGKLGLGTAYIEAMNWGLRKGYEYFVEMDADFSHDPRYLPDMLRTLMGSDVAVGSRYVLGGGTENWGLARKLLSKFGSWYSRMILGMNVRDLTGGFNGWTARVLECMHLSEVRSEGYSFQIELKYRAFLGSFSIVEFPIIFADRRVGQSKMSVKIMVEAMLRIWGLRFSRPMIDPKGSPITVRGQ